MGRRERERRPDGQSGREKQGGNRGSLSARLLSIEWEQNRRALSWGILAMLVGLFALYEGRRDEVGGQMSDDAWYLLLAKALAEGEGYTLINSPTQGIMPLYPPGFPFLLSLVWRLSPAFPENLWLLKLVSILAMLGVALLVSIHFHRDRRVPALVAMGIAVAIVSSPAFLFLAGSTVMAECVFTLTQLGAVWAIERTVRAARSEGVGWRLWGWIGLSSGLAISSLMIRSIAAIILVLAVLYFLRHRLVRVAGVFALTSLLLYLPWLIHSRQHLPTPAQRAEQNSYIVQSYTENFWFRMASYERSGRITLDELPTRVLRNLNTIFEFDLGAMLVYPLYRALEPKEVLLHFWGNHYLAMAISLLVLLGYGLVVRRGASFAEWLLPGTLVIVALWPFFPLRFLLPLAPWVLLYLLEGIRGLHGWFSGRQWLAGPWAISLWLPLLLTGVNLVSHGQYLTALHGEVTERPNWVRMFDENQKVFAWLREGVSASEEGAGGAERGVASNNPGMIYLYTGLKTVGSTDPAAHWELWKELGIRYYAIVGAYPDRLPEAPERAFTECYRSPTTNFRVVDFGPSRSRVSWSP